MMPSIAFHELAEAELNETAAYYEYEVAGLGIAFLDEVQRTLRLVQDRPASAPRIYKFVRRKLLRRFPYSVMYSVSGNNIQILAIANQKRRPFYWRGREG